MKFIANDYAFYRGTSFLQLLWICKSAIACLYGNFYKRVDWLILLSLYFAFFRSFIVENFIIEEDYLL